MIERPREGGEHDLTILSAPSGFFPESSLLAQRFAIWFRAGVNSVHYVRH